MERYRRVRELLLEGGEDDPGAEWPWLSDPWAGPADKKGANKFMLGAIMDYQMRARQVWENARRLSEDILGDPDDLWGAMADMSESSMEDVFRGPPSLHRFPGGASRRIRRIAAEIAREYGGDSSRIWRGRSPNDVMRRLHRMRAGPQTSTMIVGALLDTGQIEGRGDLKASLHSRRVLGRIFLCREATADEVLKIADRMEPGNSWLLDRYIYGLGQDVCRRRPECGRCRLRRECAYGSGFD